MRTTWQVREAKRNWAQNNPDRIKAANDRWRAGKEDLLRRQSKARMQRLRARRARR